MKTLSISQIQRELHHLNSFDIIEVVDKKRDVVKGYFLDLKYKSLIDSIRKKEKKNSLQEFAGMWEDRDIDQEELRGEAWKR
jgi:transcriptional antiterminator